MMSEQKWITQSVADCLDKVTAPACKLQTKDYKKLGQFPIVDQGQELIAGWTDNADGVVQSPLPLVVFGDHTRALKYIDFPFVRGADGTQLLKPKNDILPLFFYYACKAIDIPARGYNRHFTILKEKDVSFPKSEKEQSQIASALRKIELSASLQEDELSLAQELKRATMRELFTRGLRGEKQKETEIGLVPESWPLTPIKSLGEIVTGTTPPTKDRTFYDDGEFFFVAPGDFDHGTHILKTEKKITYKGLSVSRALPKGTTCFVCIGSTIGKVGYVTPEICASNQQINAVIPNNHFDSKYIFYLMTFYSDYIRQQASPSPVPILSKGAFEKIDIYTSNDKDEQKEMADILDAIDQKIDLHKRKKSVLEELFKSLLNKLMTGEIRVADLDLSALNIEEKERATA